MSELFSQIKNISGLEIVAGCTAIRTLPEKSISVRNIAEMLTIEKHERYIDFGSAVTLTEILNVGSSRIPRIFLEAIQTIANPNIRNMATLGGNICSEFNGQKFTLYAPLLALDAQIEIRTPTETRFEPLTNFKGTQSQEIVSSVRIPIADWNVSIFKRLGSNTNFTEITSSFAFLAATEKNTITNIRIALSGKITLRNHELENKLIGMRVPLSQKDLENAVADAEKSFDAEAVDKSFHYLLRAQFSNLVKYSLEQL